uniref:RBR-type E3 ubiquitin transferase n=1 Tax=Strix occidentalis caurina TaxID=311401 RepID=A0A8D0F5T0_STROC
MWVAGDGLWLRCPGSAWDWSAAETCIALPLAEGGELVECPLCLLPQPPQAFPSLASCHHRSCRGCLEQYLRLAVGESRVPVACPHCPAALQPADVHRLLPEPALRDKYEEFLLRRLLAADPSTRWCPAPGCSYAVIAHGCAECPRLACGREGCGTEFCYHCRQPWHPDSPCATTAPGLASPRLEPSAEDIKVCPRCSAFITKINDGGCNRMSCPVCGCLFCWLCLREISDVHFLRSAQGCRAELGALLWQLGMVLGAPMVISLVAGIAVPVITIGIPIYMGRKVLAGGPGVPVLLRPGPGRTHSAHRYTRRVPGPPLCPHSQLPCDPSNTPQPPIPSPTDSSISLRSPPGPQYLPSILGGLSGSS